MLRFQQFQEQIKGWKHAGRDLARWRAQKGKNVKLVSLKKNGEENKMHTAASLHSSREQAELYHHRVKISNPTRRIRHNIYIDGKLEGTLD